MWSLFSVYIFRLPKSISTRYLSNVSSINYKVMAYVEIFYGGSETFWQTENKTFFYKWYRLGLNNSDKWDSLA
jgi:hypothetical protein